MAAVHITAPVYVSRSSRNTGRASSSPPTDPSPTRTVTTEPRHKKLLLLSGDGVVDGEDVPVAEDDDVPDCDADDVPDTELDAVPVRDDDDVPVTELDAVPVRDEDAVPVTDDDDVPV
jgi:hypothetical protein